MPPLMGPSEKGQVVRTSLKVPLGGINDDLPSDLIGENETPGEVNGLGDNGCWESKPGSSYFGAMTHGPYGKMTEIAGDRGQKWMLAFSKSNGKMYRVNSAGTEETLQLSGADVVLDTTLPPTIFQVKAGIAYFGTEVDGWYKFSGSRTVTQPTGIPTGYDGVYHKGRVCIMTGPSQMRFSKVDQFEDNTTYKAFPTDSTDVEEPYPHILDISPGTGSVSCMKSFDNYLLLGKMTKKYFVYGSLEKTNVTIVEADSLIGILSGRTIALHEDGLLYLSSLGWHRCIEQAGVGQGRSPEYGSRRWDCGRRLRATMETIALPDAEHKGWFIEKQTDWEECTLTELNFNTAYGTIRLNESSSGATYVFTTTDTVNATWDMYAWQNITSSSPYLWVGGAQSFTVERTVTVVSIGGKFSKGTGIGTSYEHLRLIQEIRVDTGAGKPGDIVAGLGGEGPPSTIQNTTATWTDVTVNGTLVPGKTYWYCSRMRNIGGSWPSYNLSLNRIQFHGKDGSPYTGGTFGGAARTIPIPDFLNGWMQDGNYDLCFHLGIRPYVAIGTGTSPVKDLGGDISFTKAWKYIWATNSGTSTFWVRSSSTEFLRTASTPAWTTVTQGLALNTIMPKASRWRQMRVELTYGGSGLTTPDLFMMGFGYVEGNLTASWIDSASYKGRAYFAMATAAGTANDRLLVYDRDGAWRKWTGEDAGFTALCVFDDKLLGALATTASSTSHVVQLLTGTQTWNGSDISWELRWRDVNLGSPEFLKLFKRSILTAKAKTVALTEDDVSFGRRIDMADFTNYPQAYVLGDLLVAAGDPFRCITRAERTTNLQHGRGIKYDRGVWIAHKVSGTKPAEIHELILYALILTTGGDRHGGLTADPEIAN